LSIKNKSTPKWREFWDFVEKTAREVDSWPAWKRGEATIMPDTFNPSGDRAIDLPQGVPEGMTLEMPQAVHDRILQCEAVIVFEYTDADGGQWATIGGWGDRASMEDSLKESCVMAVPVGGKVERRLVMVSDLFQEPKE
jgi:hypothetical protein